MATSYQVALYSVFFKRLRRLALRKILQPFNSGVAMKLIDVEVSYDGGTILTDRVLLNTESAQVTLPPRLSLLLEVLDQCDRQKLFIAECGGDRFAVKHDSGRGYFIDFNAVVRTRGFNVTRFFRQSAGQRKLNGRFAYMLSALALIGACFEIATAPTLSVKSLGEPIALCFLSIVLLVVGHRCFAVESL
ncbi:hypothetical protein [Paraburkholderia sp. BL9I2N2]|uniref:hypothetical protein n=1 Tax=Paraburkholderia sp. BL9I2N2 TaxID=1938809 RepID=UPI00104CE1E5|nr:hypothetical protein [Paraburkholderia sp. BL9I2N2]